jgi:hypothetical protein
MNTSLKVLKARMPSFTQMVDATESFLSTHIDATIKFLDEHPGIAMTLSPTTVTRRAAQKHIDKVLNVR